MSLILHSIGNNALEAREEDRGITEAELRALDFADLSAVVASRSVDVYSDLCGADRDVVFAKVEWCRAVWQEYETIQKRGRGSLEDAVTMVALRDPDIGAELATAGKKNSDARKARNARQWIHKQLGLKHGKPNWSNWKALAPRYGQKQPATIDPDFRALVLKLYLHPNCLALKSCLRKAARIWRMEGGDEAAICSYDQISYYVKTRVTKQVLIKYREGRSAYDNTVKGHIKREVNAEPGEVWFSDHRIMDCFCRVPHPDNPEEWVATRPYMTVIQDARSGLMVAAKIYAAQAPNHEIVIDTLQSAMIRSGGVAPKTFYTDWGSDFLKYGLGRPVELKTSQGEWLHDKTGEVYRYSIFQALMRCDHHKAGRYNGKEKPVERGFGSAADFDRMQHAYTGSDTTKRPDIRDTWQGDVMRLPAVQQLQDGFEDWLANEHHVREREDGKTMIEMWEGRRIDESRRMTEMQLLMALLLPDATARKVGRSAIGRCGVKFEGWQYSHIDLEKYADDYVMVKTYFGMPRVTLGGRERHAGVFVFTPDDRFICAAPADQTAHMLAETEEEKEKLGRMKHLINYVASRHTKEFQEHTGETRLISPSRVLEILPGHGRAAGGEDRTHDMELSAPRPTRRLRKASDPVPAATAAVDEDTRALWEEVDDMLLSDEDESGDQGDDMPVSAGDIDDIIMGSGQEEW